MTLVELLTVITIIVILLAIAIPSMRPAMKERKIREASRMVSAYIARAKAEAAGSGRPAGFWIERKGDHTGPIENYSQADQIYIAEVPPPYAGDIEGARAEVFLNTTVVPNRWEVRFDATSASIPGLIDNGDTFQISFDHKGNTYEAVRSGNSYILLLDASPPFSILNPDPPPPPTALVDPPPPPTALVTRGAQYQIFRLPQRSAIKPIDLPPGIVIDLTVSGVGSTGIEFNPNRPGNPAAQATLEARTPIVVMFNPSGNMEKIYLGNLGRRPIGAVNLMLGRIDQVLPATPLLDDEALKANLMDLSSLWVTVSDRTGKATTAENANTNPPPAGDTFAQKIFRAREFARSSIEMGGRER